MAAATAASAAAFSARWRFGRRTLRRTSGRDFRAGLGHFFRFCFSFFGGGFALLGLRCGRLGGMEEAVWQRSPPVRCRHSGRRWRKGHALTGIFSSGNFGRGRRRGSAKPLDGFSRFRAPLVAPEALVGFAVPFESFAFTLALLMDFGQLEGHHGVARLQEKLFEFCGSVCPRARFADARLNLLPITHGPAF
jgi:hypothetical protein